MITKEDKEAIIEAIKKQWIEDFGQLQEKEGDDDTHSCYFVTGFVGSVLDKMVMQQQPVKHKRKSNIPYQSLVKELGIGMSVMDQRIDERHIK